MGDSMAPAMTRRGLLAGLAAAGPLLLLAGCGKGGATAVQQSPTAAQPSTSTPAGSPAADRTTTVMIIRHGEKPDSSHPGLDEEGKTDGKSLTQRGWDRARALPQLFAPAEGHPLAAGIARPASIYAAADQGPHAGAHRMRQTVTPLARQLGLRVDTSCAEGGEGGLAAAVLAAPQPVLIAWEHSRIPDIVKALGAAQAGAPASWPDRFDLVWVFTRTGAGGPWSFRQVGQHLLDGDA